jgi:hypothetical protein
MCEIVHFSMVRLINSKLARIGSRINTDQPEMKKRGVLSTTGSHNVILRFG